MLEYRFATEEHRRDIIDFINYVFSQASCPHDFKTLIPKVYADGRGYADIHAIALDDGYVRGVVAQLPQKFSFAGQTLTTGYIGSVSSYKYTRGSGHMIRLMDMQAKKAEADGIDIMLLGGQRQRYEYYGYSPCGAQYGYTITSANIRHALKNVCADGIAFVPFSQAEAHNIDSAHALYLRQPITDARPREDFEIILRSWNCTPYLVMNNDACIGYVVASGTDSFSEMVLTESGQIKPVIKAWFSAFGISRLNIAAPSYDAPLNRALASFAEGYHIGAAIHARIVNLKNVLSACLALKAATAGLSDGRVVLQMENEAPVCAECKNGIINVFETAEAPEISLDRLSMQQYLFSPNRYSAPELPDKTGWFPLPLHLYGPDHF